MEKLCDKAFDLMNCWIWDGKSKSMAMSFDRTVSGSKTLKRRWNVGSGRIKFLNVIARLALDMEDPGGRIPVQKTGIRSKAPIGNEAGTMNVPTREGIVIEWIGDVTREMSQIFLVTGETVGEVLVVMAVGDVMIKDQNRNRRLPENP